jgi:hypothetical protein
MRGLRWTVGATSDESAPHKFARRYQALLLHRNLDTKQRAIVFMSGVSFSFEYAALIKRVFRLNPHNSPHGFVLDSSLSKALGQPDSAAH